MGRFGPYSKREKADNPRKEGIRVKDPHFWRTMYKEAEKDAEHFKRWRNAYLLLLIIATLAIMYLMKGRG